MNTQDETVNQNAQQIIHKANDLATFAGPDSFFTGSVSVKMLTAVNDSINSSSAYVSFQAQARSFWHTHPKGQYLVVTEGNGLVQEWGQAARQLAIGDVVWCPPGVKHWHGAACHCSMTHLALTGSDENGKNVDWLEPVSQEQYLAAKRSAK